MVLTCVFVVWVCFLTLVTASLLEEEGSTLHHEEALAKTAKTNGGVNKNPRDHRRPAEQQPLSTICTSLSKVRQKQYAAGLELSTRTIKWT